MRYVELTPNVRSSVLGFGCAPILGSVDETRAKHALFRALDLGITHFDLARSYGFGRAERFVGSLLRSERSRLTIATKFGIEATALASVLAPIKPMVRLLRDSIRPFATESKAVAAETKMSTRYLLKKVPLSRETMINSLHKSLRELRTDYVDLLLVHEPLDGRSFAELHVVADELKRVGKIRAWGVTFTLQHRSNLGSLGYFDVLQHDCSAAPVDCGVVAVADKKVGRVLFSPFSRRSQSVEMPNEDHRGNVLRQLERQYPGSVIVSSMSSVEHVRQNCEALG